MADAMCEWLSSNAKKEANYKNMVTYGHLSLVSFGWEKQNWINLQFSHHPTMINYGSVCFSWGVFVSSSEVPTVMLYLMRRVGQAQRDSQMSSFLTVRKVCDYLRI